MGGGYIESGRYVGNGGATKKRNRVVKPGTTFLKRLLTR